MNGAETAYLFRHEMLRDAAYQLQLPGDRAKLHALAFATIEELAGGPPPDPGPLDVDSGAPPTHPADAFAEELAEHARLAKNASPSPADGWTSSRRRCLRRAAEQADRQYYGTSVRLWIQLSDLLDGSQRGEALLRAGKSAYLAGRHREAEPLYERALACQREAGHRRGEAVALDLLGLLVQDDSARTAVAEDYFRQALGIVRELADRKTEGRLFVNLANLFRQTGRMQEAERAFGEGLDLVRAVGDRASERTLLGNLAAVYHETGRSELAERTCEQALAIDRETANPRLHGMVFGNLANIYYTDGRYARAEENYLKALAIARESGSRRLEGLILGNLTGLYQATARGEEAERACHEALAINREVGNRRSEGIALGNLASLCQTAGRHEHSLRAFEEALAIHREVGNRRFEGAQSCDFALLKLALRDFADARATWLRGAARLRDLGDRAVLDRKTADMRASCAAAGIPPFDDVSL